MFVLCMIFNILKIYSLPGFLKNKTKRKEKKKKPSKKEKDDKDSESAYVFSHLLAQGRVHVRIMTCGWMLLSCWQESIVYVKIIVCEWMDVLMQLFKKQSKVDGSPGHQMVKC